jgi:hypothetical protein
MITGRFLIAVVTIAITIIAHSFSEKNSFVAQKYSLGQQAVVWETGQRAYVLGVNLTSFTEGYEYSCISANGICIVHFDESKIHTDTNGGNPFKYVFINDIVSVDPGLFSQN